MVRETRHLWVGNLPENIKEDKIHDYFKRYGKVQSVKILNEDSGGQNGSSSSQQGGSSGVSATVAFIDIRSAAKAHRSDNKIDERTLKTCYYEPPAGTSTSASSTAVYYHEKDDTPQRPSTTSNQPPVANSSQSTFQDFKSWRGQGRKPQVEYGSQGYPNYFFNRSGTRGDSSSASHSWERRSNSFGNDDRGSTPVTSSSYTSSSTSRYPSSSGSRASLATVRPFRGSSPPSQHQRSSLSSSSTGGFQGIRGGSGAGESSSTRTNTSSNRYKENYYDEYSDTRTSRHGGSGTGDLIDSNHDSDDGGAYYDSVRGRGRSFSPSTRRHDANTNSTASTSLTNEKLSTRDRQNEGDLISPSLRNNTSVSLSRRSSDEINTNDSSSSEWKFADPHSSSGTSSLSRYKSSGGDSEPRASPNRPTSSSFNRPPRSMSPPSSSTASLAAAAAAAINRDGKRLSSLSHSSSGRSSPKSESPINSPLRNVNDSTNSTSLLAKTDCDSHWRRKSVDEAALALKEQGSLRSRPESISSELMNDSLKRKHSDPDPLESATSLLHSSTTASSTTPTSCLESSGLPGHLERKKRLLAVVGPSNVHRDRTSSQSSHSGLSSGNSLKTTTPPEKKQPDILKLNDSVLSDAAMERLGKELMSHLASLPTESGGAKEIDLNSLKQQQARLLLMVTKIASQGSADVDIVDPSPTLNLETSTNSNTLLPHHQPSQQTSELSVPSNAPISKSSALLNTNSSSSSSSTQRKCGSNLKTGSSSLSSSGSSKPNHGATKETSSVPLKTVDATDHFVNKSIPDPRSFKSTATGSTLRCNRRLERSDACDCLDQGDPTRVSSTDTLIDQKPVTDESSGEVHSTTPKLDEHCSSEVSSSSDQVNSQGAVTSKKCSLSSSRSSSESASETALGCPAGSAPTMPIASSPATLRPGSPMSLPLPEFAISYRSAKSHNVISSHASPKSTAIMSPLGHATTLGLQGGSTASATTGTNGGFSPNFSSKKPHHHHHHHHHHPIVPGSLTKDQIIANRMVKIETASCVSSTDLAEAAGYGSSKSIAMGTALTVKSKSEGDDSAMSQVSPTKMSMEDRIRALDEKYTAWSGATSATAASGNAIGKLNEKTPTVDYSKYHIKKKSQVNLSSSMDSQNNKPSDIVKSLLSKSSIFDQDSKRLELINEKYEPKSTTLSSSTSLTSSLSVSIEEKEGSSKSAPFRTKAAAKEFSSPLTTESKSSLPLENTPPISSASLPKTPSHSFNSSSSSNSTSSSHHTHSSSLTRKLSEPTKLSSNACSSNALKSPSPQTPHSAPLKSNSNPFGASLSSSTSTSQTSRLTKSGSVSGAAASGATKPLTAPILPTLKMSPNDGLKKPSPSALEPPRDPRLMSSIKKDHQTLTEKIKEKSQVVAPMHKTVQESTVQKKITTSSSSAQATTNKPGPSTHLSGHNASSSQSKIDKNQGSRQRLSSETMDSESDWPSTSNPKKDSSSSKANDSTNSKKTDKEANSSSSKKSQNDNSPNNKSSANEKHQKKEEKKEKKQKEEEKKKDEEKKKSKDKDKSNKSNKPEKITSDLKKQSDSKDKDGKKEKREKDKKKEKEKNKEREKKNSERKFNSELAKLGLDPFSEPVYFSMYDAVKARSSKRDTSSTKDNKPDLDAVRSKFSQLKQSRAKKEEKAGRSSQDTESDSDSDSDSEPVKMTSKSAPSAHQKKRKIVLETTTDESSDSDHKARKPPSKKNRRKEPSKSSKDTDSESDDAVGSPKKPSTMQSHQQMAKKKHKPTVYASDSSSQDAQPPVKKPALSSTKIPSKPSKLQTDSDESSEEESVSINKKSALNKSQQQSTNSLSSKSSSQQDLSNKTQHAKGDRHPKRPSESEKSEKSEKPEKLGMIKKRSDSLSLPNIPSKDKEREREKEKIELQKKPQTIDKKAKKEYMSTQTSVKKPQSGGRQEESSDSKQKKLAMMKKKEMKSLSSTRPSKSRLSETESDSSDSDDSDARSSSDDTDESKSDSDFDIPRASGKKTASRGVFSHTEWEIESTSTIDSEKFSMPTPPVSSRVPSMDRIKLESSSVLKPSSVDSNKDPVSKEKLSSLGFLKKSSSQKDLATTKSSSIEKKRDESSSESRIKKDSTPTLKTKEFFKSPSSSSLHSSEESVLIREKSPQMKEEKKKLAKEGSSSSLSSSFKESQQQQHPHKEHHTSKVSKESHKESIAVAKRQDHSELGKKDSRDQKEPKEKGKEKEKDKDFERFKVEVREKTTKESNRGKERESIFKEPKETKEKEKEKEKEKDKDKDKDSKPKEKDRKKSVEKRPSIDKSKVDENTHTKRSSFSSLSTSATSISLNDSSIDDEYRFDDDLEEDARKLEQLLRESDNNSCDALLPSFSSGKSKDDNKPKERKFEEEAAIETQRLEQELKHEFRPDMWKPVTSLVSSKSATATTLALSSSSSSSAFDDLLKSTKPANEMGKSKKQTSPSAHPKVETKVPSGESDPFINVLSPRSGTKAASDKIKLEHSEEEHREVEAEPEVKIFEEERNIEDDLAVSALLQEMNVIPNDMSKETESYVQGATQSLTEVNYLSSVNDDDEHPLHIAEPSPEQLSEDAELRSLTEEVAERISTMQEKEDDSQNDDDDVSPPGLAPGLNNVSSLDLITKTSASSSSSMSATSSTVPSSKSMSETCEWGLNQVTSSFEEVPFKMPPTMQSNDAIASTQQEPAPEKVSKSLPFEGFFPLRSPPRLSIVESENEFKPEPVPTSISQISPRFSQQSQISPASKSPLKSPPHASFSPERSRILSPPPSQSKPQSPRLQGHSDIPHRDHKELSIESFVPQVNHEAKEAKPEPKSNELNTSFTNDERQECEQDSSSKNERFDSEDQDSRTGDDHDTSTNDSEKREGGRPRRGRRAKTQKFAESSLQLPRYETGCEPQGKELRRTSLRASTLGKEKEADKAPEVPERPRRSTRINHEQQQQQGSHDSSEKNRPDSEADKDEQEDDQERKQGKRERRGKRTALPFVPPPADSQRSNDAPSTDGKSKEVPRITLSLQLPLPPPEKNEEARKQRSPYDVFEFRDSDEDEPAPRPLETIHSSSKVNLPTNNTSAAGTQEAKQAAPNSLPLATSALPVVSHLASTSGPITTTASASMPLSSAPIPPPTTTPMLLMTSTPPMPSITPDSKQVETLKSGEPATSSTSEQLSSQTSQQQPQGNKEYVTELQHGKLAITIRVAKDGHESTTTTSLIEQPPKSKSVPPSSCVDEEKTKAIDNTSATSASAPGTADTPAKATRKSARLMSMSKTSIDEVIDAVVKGMYKEGELGRPRRTRATRRSEDTPHVEHEEESREAKTESCVSDSDSSKSAPPRAYRLTRSAARSSGVLDESQDNSNGETETNRKPGAISSAKVETPKNARKASLEPKSKTDTLGEIPVSEASGHGSCKLTPSTNAGETLKPAAQTSAEAETRRSPAALVDPVTGILTPVKSDAERKSPSTEKSDSKPAVSEQSDKQHPPANTSISQAPSVSAPNSIISTTSDGPQLRIATTASTVLTIPSTSSGIVTTAVSSSPFVSTVPPKPITSSVNETPSRVVSVADGPRLHPSNTAMKLKSGKCFMDQNPSAYKVVLSTVPTTNSEPVKLPVTTAMGYPVPASQASKPLVASKTPIETTKVVIPEIKQVITTSTLGDLKVSKVQSTSTVTVSSQEQARVPSSHGAIVSEAGKPISMPTSVLTMHPSLASSSKPGPIPVLGTGSASAHSSASETQESSNVPDLLQNRQLQQQKPIHVHSQAPPPPPSVRSGTPVTLAEHIQGFRSSPAPSTSPLTSLSNVPNLPPGFGNAMQMRGLNPTAVMMAASRLPPEMANNYIQTVMAEMRAQEALAASIAPNWARYPGYPPGFPIPPPDKHSLDDASKNKGKDLNRERRMSQVDDQAPQLSQADKHPEGIMPPGMSPLHPPSSQMPQLRIHPGGPIPPHLSSPQERYAPSSEPSGLVPPHRALPPHLAVSQSSDISKESPGLKADDKLPPQSKLQAPQISIPSSIDFRNAGAMSSPLAVGPTPFRKDGQPLTPLTPMASLSNADADPMRRQLPRPPSYPPSKDSVASPVPPHSIPASASVMPPFMQYPPPPGTDILRRGGPMLGVAGLPYEAQFIPGALELNPHHPSESLIMQSPIIMQKYQIHWQGYLSLKNDQATVQMHFLSGNLQIPSHGLPPMGPEAPGIKITQRMRLEPSQLDGVSRRIQMPEDHCIMLAVPCGRDPLDAERQTAVLRTGFIKYLQEKQAAGIVNTTSPINNQMYVVHIFPICEFAIDTLIRVTPELWHYIKEGILNEYLLVIITTAN